MDAPIQATREQLAAAFDEWARRAVADPSAFNALEMQGYGSGAADYLIGLLQEQGA